MPHRVRPEAPPNFDVTPASLTAKIADIVQESYSLHQSLTTTWTTEKATFANVVRPLVDDENRAESRLIPLTHLLAGHSPDPDVRSSARKGMKVFAAWETNRLVNPGLAALVAAVHERSGSDNSIVDSEDKYLLDQLYHQYRRSGSNIAHEKTRARLQAAQAEVSDLLGAAQAEFAEDTSGVWLSQDALAGLPETWLSLLKTEEDRFWITFRDAHYRQAMQHASDPATRRRLYQAKERRFPANVERLARVAVLRDEIARLVGYTNHAALKMEERMAESAEETKAWLLKLRLALYPLAMKQVRDLLALKQADTDDPDEASTLFVWDEMYYTHKEAKGEFAVDSDKVAEYFEVQHTLQGMLRVLEQVFSLEFERIDTSVWHRSVQAYAVWDSLGGGAFLGYLYLDFFARKGKQPDPHHMGIRPGFTEQDGTRHYPTSGFACSFPEPSDDRPTLLQHRDVRIIFHELGHAMHSLVARTKYARSHPKDFIEIPSKLLEYWTWEPAVLVRLSKHYTTLGTEDEGKMPLELAESISRTMALGKALGMLSLIPLAMFDLILYSPESHEEAGSLDTTALWNRLRDELGGTSSGDATDQGFGQAGVNQLFKGYDVAYYAYVTAMTHAADLYAVEFIKDPMSRIAGERYRRTVLEPGSSIRPEKLMHDYQQHEPNMDSLLHEICVFGEQAWPDIVEIH